MYNDINIMHTVILQNEHLTIDVRLIDYRMDWLKAEPNQNKTLIQL